MNIAAYCRVSTDSADQLNSLEAQKHFFEQYAAKHGHTLVHVYADEGISGTRVKNRKQFLRLMDDARLGLFSMVVVKDISRFARNTVDLLSSTRLLKALNIETLFLTSNMTALGNSEFVLTVFGALAQEESANTSKRVKFGKRLNAEKGRVPNIVYGYDKTPGDYYNLKINRAEAEIVQRIFDLYINHGVGAHKIARMLNEEGEKTKRGCDWTQNAVSRILSNEIYIGHIINGKQEVKDFLTGQRRNRDVSEWLVTKKNELCIVSHEAFYKARDILIARNGGSERHSDKHLFSTLIKCAECERSFHRVKHTYKNTYVRWVCGKRNSDGAISCKNSVSVDENQLSISLRVYFGSILEKRGGAAKCVARELKRLYRSDDSQTDARRRLSTAQKARRKYIDMYIDDVITRAEMRAKTAVLADEIARAQSELHALRRGGDVELEQAIQHVLRCAEGVPDILTNAQLKRIIQKITVDVEGNTDVYIQPMQNPEDGGTFHVSHNCT